MSLLTSLYKNPLSSSFMTDSWLDLYFSMQHEAESTACRSHIHTSHVKKLTAQSSRMFHFHYDQFDSGSVMGWTGTSLVDYTGHHMLAICTLSVSRHQDEILRPFVKYILYAVQWALVLVPDLLWLECVSRSLLMLLTTSMSIVSSGTFPMDLSELS